MTDFFVYRSCDITGTEARKIVQRNADILNRGLALIQGDSGVPADDGNGSDNPDIPIVSAVWGDPVDGNGQLPPGTYDYKIIPINTCTGRTGKAQSLPSLTVPSLGKVATLRMKLSSKPTDCNAALLQRNGVVVGNTIPTTSLGDNVPIVSSPDPNGTFVTGAADGFTRASGADLIVGDSVLYQGFAVQVSGVAGNAITINPPVPAQLVTPPGFYDMFNRTGIYEGISTGLSATTFLPVPFVPSYGGPPKWPTALGPIWPGPFFSFTIVGYPVSTAFLADLQPGDIINYGSKTALVIHVETVGISLWPGYPTLGTVLVIPFGILPIPPLPLGIFQIVFRSGLIPTFGEYHNGTDTTFKTFSSKPTVEDFQNDSGMNDGAQFVYDASFVGVSSVTLVTLGTTASVASFSLGVMTVTGLSGMSLLDLGNFLTISGASAPGNNGSFLIVGFNSGSSVDVLNLSGFAPDANNGALEWAKGPIYEYEVTLTPQLQPFDFGVPPISITRPMVPFGVWATVPRALSPYLTPPNVTTSGNYVRLSRLVSTTTDNDILQIQETGANQDRAGTVDGTDAKTALDQVFVQNNYPGGLAGLLDKVRGPRATIPAKVFVKTNGALVQIGQKLKAVNTLAKKGTGTLISLTKLRLFRDSLCGSWANVAAMNSMLQDQGFAAARFEAREVLLEPAACPPGQTNVREVQLFCVGLATPQVKVKEGEQVRFYWSEGRRAVPGVKKKLIALGLTADEADSAAQLQTSGRLLSVVEVALSEGADLVDFGGLGPAKDLDAVLDDTRIETINTGSINRTQIGDILRVRGSKGIIKRPPRTDPATFLEPGFLPIDDFALPVHNLAGLALSLQLSFDVCDFDGALASLPDGPLKTSLAAFFAVIEAALNGLVLAGQAILKFIEDGPFTDAVDAIAALISAIVADPTLACLIGPTGSVPFPGLDGIPQVDQFLQGFAFPFQVRFDLSQLLGEAIASILCSIIGGLVTAIGNFGGAALAAFAQRAIGCIPALDLGLQFPSLDVQIAIECSLEQLNIFLDIIQALIAEANEVVDFINNIGAGGFVMRSIQAQNNACSSGTDLQSLIGGLTALAG